MEEKNLKVILKKHSGRDNTGSISVRHQGGRQKRYYRLIDFKRDKRDVEGEVTRIERDPNRNALIALVKYKDNELRYIIQPAGLKDGDKVIASVKADIKIGNALPLKNIPIGVSVHDVEIYPGRGGQMARSAGTTAVVVAKEDLYTQLKLQSGEIRRFLNDCWATIGQVGNIEHKDEVIGRAGRNILMGIRPTVRGTAQDPRSHPHGGGEGKSGEGMHPKTPWGKPARGKRTRDKNRWNKHLIIKRRKP
ncbi:50S ribosomal protein L2 [Candidatus Roizmanbacteria bacterium CG_4_10_14_0_2_um_filter_36_35]|uniref:Large ribosomal subunit protein uL2 n=4 Tax=Candidatus Roizmaniibacteriota TaxID=1752723 RepID=A0A2M7BXK2_9BACT|nr:MAG: 50S ribosomal protein L2 [Candidatus Roizmanbacteria bacterium CG11_big_fil_rev_8_21_14_0_20_35_14]PIV11294.1 MAG: 50S ribosomal protein L2 [Candidatus Roizmanbacteria bacterium CG03_land_8_20_14_0_80_35_26]PIZ67393.1 MAG: 50S ribosomal protein L2 [Candidatus Roizmanbacteria bacterium CG_4_10_14_0_2_um_filter_36_35]PJC32953.1 MAG: 50S ribosomal protein L2 [Candidatus Roizmanbacteria bacterium CG_4_9_14_0_2_um_filter_36_12]PJC80481.1 MAG: 50S ribosomal protein L2 [Candidatus Roizmanbacte